MSFLKNVLKDKRGLMGMDNLTAYLLIAQVVLVLGTVAYVLISKPESSGLAAGGAPAAPGGMSGGPMMGGPGMPGGPMGGPGMPGGPMGGPGMPGGPMGGPGMPAGAR